MKVPVIKAEDKIAMLFETMEQAEKFMDDALKPIENENKEWRDWDKERGSYKYEAPIFKKTIEENETGTTITYKLHWDLVDTTCGKDESGLYQEFHENFFNVYYSGNTGVQTYTIEEIETGTKFTEWDSD